MERISRTVEEKNEQLQSYARVKKFVIVAEDFTVENGLLTPTLKVKRKVIREKYQSVIDGLYG